VNWFIFFLHIIALLSVIILIDIGLLRYFFASVFSCRTKKTQADESRLDDDVLAERRRILRSNNPSYRVNTENVLPDEEMIANDHLIVQDLKKQFPKRPWPAVNHLTFGAKRGEAFGLLGFNVGHLFLSSPHSSLILIRELVKPPRFAFWSAMKQPHKARPTSMDRMFAIVFDPFAVSAIVHNRIVAWSSSACKMVFISWHEYAASLENVFHPSCKPSVLSSYSIHFSTTTFISSVVEPNDDCMQHSLSSVILLLTLHIPCVTVISLIVSRTPTRSHSR
jgi:hypothetical protein